MRGIDGPWNHNVHYHRVLLRAVPNNAAAALDVGCGDGRFARKLSGVVESVHAIDSSQEMIDSARRDHGDAANLHFRCEDFLLAPFPPAAFDYVSSLAALHHMPFPDALQRMADLLRTGGVLAILGMYDEQTPADLRWARVATHANRFYRWRHGDQPYESPTRPPAMTLEAIRNAASELLPGSRVRRHLLWRYSLLWRKA